MEQCGFCGKAENPARALLRCSRCKTMRYCSRDCQAGHWSVHKVTCSPQVPDTKETTKKPSGSPGAHQSPWQLARSRAAAAFPDGSQIVDDLEELKQCRIAVQHFSPRGDISFPMTPRDPYVPTPSLSARMDGVAEGAVVVLRLASQIYHPLRPEWTLEDSKGRTTIHVRFECGQLFPFMPSTFRLQGLEKGHFLCVKDPQLMMMSPNQTSDHSQIGGPGFTVITVMDASTVRVFPPR